MVMLLTWEEDSVDSGQDMDRMVALTSMVILVLSYDDDARGRR